jgi:hypothetical protein
MLEEIRRPERPDWFLIFRCFRLATNPGNIWLGFLGSIFTVLMLVVALFFILEVRQFQDCPASRQALEQIRQGQCAAMLRTVRVAGFETLSDAGGDLRRLAASVFGPHFLKAVREAEALKRVLFWGMFVWWLTWLPWAFFGGAISRSVSFELATGERISTAAAREYAIGHYSSYFWPPVTAGLVLLGMFGAGIALGWMAAHPVATLVALVAGLVAAYVMVVVKQRSGSSAIGKLVGLAGLAVVGALVWLASGLEVAWLAKLLMVLAFPVLIVLGIAFLFLLTVWVFGRGLMISSVSFEATDAFDALMRSAHYVIRQAWRLGLYFLIGMLYLIPCLAVVLFLALGGYAFAGVAAWLGFGEDFAGVYGALMQVPEWTTVWEAVPAWLLRGVFLVLCGLVAGWCVSFKLAFHAACYALLRRWADLAPFGEIFTEAGELQARRQPTETTS